MSAADALAEYANPLNWALDESGIRRVWLEPGSSTPTAYNGFELARAAMEEDNKDWPCRAPPAVAPSNCGSQELQDLILAKLTTPLKET